MATNRMLQWVVPFVVLTLVSLFASGFQAQSLLFRIGRGKFRNNEKCKMDPLSELQSIPISIAEPESLSLDPWGQFKAILFYEPPVGAIAVFIVLRLVWTGRIFRLRSGSAASASAEGMWMEAETKRYKRSRLQRSMLLDSDDQSYDTFGGVQRIRRKLCWAALQEIDASTKQAAKPALDALSITYSSDGGRANFIEEICKPLSMLQRELLANDAAAQLDADNEEDLLLRVSAGVCEVRALDVLLRLTRDRLIVTCSRLHRTVRHWERRVRLHQRVGFFFRKLFKKRYDRNTDAYQLRLALAKAAFEAEKDRLGTVQRLLIERPAEMSDEGLLMSLSEREVKKPEEDKAVLRRSMKQKRVSMRMPTLSKLTLRWNEEGSGRLSINLLDRDTSLNSTSAWKLLVEDCIRQPAQWINEALQWSKRTRCVITESVKESLPSSTANRTGFKNDLTALDRWSAAKSNSVSGLERDWKTVLSLVDSLDEYRRVGEGRHVAIGSDISRGLGRFDFFGIPSAFLTILTVQLLRNYLLPFWPQFCEMLLKAYDITWTIIEKRFWKPIYGIVKGLIAKKSESITDNFDLDNEEHSLDNMLRDLGLGDGTDDSRKAALQGASRAYEKSLDRGVFRSVVRGRLVRLLLVQVQQLKAGLLRALQQIDVLVDANKLNLQILAAIPSVLIVVFGTRFFLRFLLAFRSRDIRPLEEIHDEMAECLDKMEKALVLARSNEKISDAIVVKSQTPMLQPPELGDFVVQIHSYLVLMDYCSPPFPLRTCDTIQTSLQELLTLQGSTHALETSQQVALVRLIKDKHKDLEKYI